MQNIQKPSFDLGATLAPWLHAERLLLMAAFAGGLAIVGLLVSWHMMAVGLLVTGLLLLTYKIPAWTRPPLLLAMFVALMIMIELLTNWQITLMVLALFAGVMISNREELPDRLRYALCVIVLLMVYAIPMALFGVRIGAALGILGATLYTLTLQLPNQLTRAFFAFIGLSLVTLVMDVFGIVPTAVTFGALAFVTLYDAKLHTVEGKVTHTIVTIVLLALGLTVFADWLGSMPVGVLVAVIISGVLLTPGQIGGATWERGLFSRLELETVYGRASYRLIVIGLLLLAVTVVFPFLFTFTAGLKTPRGIYTSGLQLWPDDPLWITYQRAWERFNIPRLMANTVVIVVGALFMQIGVSTLAAYSLSRLKPIGGRFIMMGFLLTLMIPSIAYLVPLYVTAAELKLLGSYWGIWLPAGVNAFMIFVLKSFFDGLPAELFDAAKVDGANPLQILWRIVLPLSRPILLVFSILTFVNFWKDFLWPYLILLRRPEMQPIAVRLYFINEATNVPMNLQMAAYFMAMLPPLVIAVILQRYMQQGMSIGAVKG